MSLGKFADIAGPDRFYDAPETLEAYSKDHSFTTPRKPLAVMKPRHTDDIKEIIDLANETLVNIIPTSSGFPKFHGDTIPACAGITLDLSDLNQVLRVDRRNKIAIIEPGVTFGKLRYKLEEQGMVPYTPLLPRSTKSVLTSALEREPITIPKDHWDFNDPLAGGQVVIGDGHVQGFGDSAGRSKKEIEDGTAVPVFPLGPSNIGWLTMIQGAQGTLGIVRWASVRCRTKPSIQRPSFVVTEDLREIIPFVQKVLKPRLVEEIFIINSFSLANVISEEVNEIRNLRSILPKWALFVNVAGYERYPEEEVAWKEAHLKELASQDKLVLRDAVSGFSATSLLKILERTSDKDRRLRYKDSCQVLPFSTILDKMTELTLCLTRIAEDYAYPSTDLSIYIQPIIQGCQCDCEVVFPYNPHDKQETEQVRKLFITAAKEMNNIGAYYSRPYGPLADITYKDSGVANILRKIKGILDPNDIMNSGKLYMANTLL
jgi:FAD/FMN-containing dehydrogenase